MEKIPSFIQLIESRIIRSWDDPVLSNYKESTYRYKDVASQIAWLHIIYEQMGVRCGDRIAICAPNSSRWGIVFLSILTYGAVPVPILSEFNPEQLQNIVNHSESRLLFVSEAIYKQIKESEMPGIEGFFKLEDYSLLLSRQERFLAVCQQLTSLFGQKYPDGLKKDNIGYHLEESPEALAMINYTSGTTGFSKGVMIPYRALWSNYDFAHQALGKVILEGGKIVSLLPMAHMYGMMFEFLIGFLTGCHVFFLGKTPSPTIVARAFAEIRPQIIIAVPLIIEKIVRKSIMPQLAKSKAAKYMKTPILGYFVRHMVRHKVMKVFGGNLYEIIVGGAALNQAVETFLHSINFPIAIGYGATECAPIICYEDWKRLVPRSCGKVAPHLELRIDSPEPEKIPGEILVRGLNVMHGYYKNEEDTRKTLDAEGWYHSGDLGTIDNQGNVFIRGRIKNMILGASGQNIYPEEIEDKLNSMLMVSESIVVQREGKLVALVHPDYDEARSLGLTDENLAHIMQLNRTDLNEMIPSYESIQSFIVQKDEFEKTPKKSIKRFLYQ